MANVDLGRYRRIVQMFWDPEPTNDMSADQPIWCLGCSYQLADDMTSQTARGKPTPDEKVPGKGPTVDKQTTPPEPLMLPMERDTANPPPVPLVRTPETPPESTSSSFSSSLAYGGAEQERETGWPQRFLDDFESRFWMTYRSDFEPIQKSSDPKASSALSFSMRIKTQLGDASGFSSDSGWGCMIRSGQSLLANAIAMVRLGRDWRRGQMHQEERELISLFADDPRAPYSIHNFVAYGAAACGKYPGEWFGPSATARCIQALANTHESAMKVYSTGDGPDVYEDDFMRIAQQGEEFHPTLILVGTRLGIDKITPVYWQALIASLQMPQSIGIAGGRPSSSHYFVGVQGDFLFYLDPHHTRKALPYHAEPATYTDQEIESCHTTRLRRVHVREMDPSMLIGFLIHTKNDWIEWRRCVKDIQGKSIINISEGRLGRSATPPGREGAIDEVEPLSDDDAETVLEA